MFFWSYYCWLAAKTTIGTIAKTLPTGQLNAANALTVCSHRIVQITS